MSKVERLAIRQRIVDCFVGVDWTKQSFVVDGRELKDANGGSKFLSDREIMKGIDKLNILLRELESGKPAKPPLNPWKEAVQDACVLRHLDFDESDPKKNIDVVINWEVDVNLDPSVSSSAAALLNKGIMLGELRQVK